MSSVVDICNLALSHIGDGATVASIASPAESVQAEHCARFYPMARDAVLSMVEPAFAIKRVNLSLITPTEQPDIWTYAYSQPNCIKVLSVGLPEATLVDADRQEWDSEALDDGSVVIYTNTELATARIIARITDTTKFGPLLVLAVARLLASFLAGPIIKGVEGMKISAAHQERFDKVELPRAKTENARLKQSNAYRDFTPSSISARG
jgi:hypothetical protein